MGWQWHHLEHTRMQIICMSLQTDNHTSTSSLNFYKLDALLVFSTLMLLVGRQEGHLAWNWVVSYWCGYLSGVRCKWFGYGPADATATTSSLAPVKIRMVYLSGAGLPRLSWKKPLNGCSSSSSSRCSSWRPTVLSTKGLKDCEIIIKNIFNTLNQISCCISVTIHDMDSCWNSSL